MTVDVPGYMRGVNSSNEEDVHPGCHQLGVATGAATEMPKSANAWAWGAIGAAGTAGGVAG